MHGHTTQTDEQRGGPRTPLRRALCVLLAPLALSAIATGCGGANSPAAGVAHLGSSGKSSATTTGTAASSGGPSEQPGAQAVAFSACMRSHGVPNFPDPKISTSGNGVSVRIGIPAGVNPNGATFKSAQQACHKLLPEGGPSHARTIDPQEQAQYLKVAACVRAHGVPNFPDPTFSGGGVHIDQQKINQRSPAFQAAVQACKSLIPGGLHGGGGG